MKFQFARDTKNYHVYKQVDGINQLYLTDADIQAMVPNPSGIPGLNKPQVLTLPPFKAE